ncbi:MAG: thioredoxin family protein [Candidatus Eisenbacteria bacterium]|nr:thioredoxin family protein [Candidatus Eisenbacteria bacterium]
MRAVSLSLMGVVLLCLLPGVLAGQDGIQWMTDYETGLERARIERKPVMIDFYTSWCYYCKVLDAKTYKDPEVVRLSGQFVCIKINAERHRDLARRYRIAAYPIMVFLSRDGLEKTRVYGYQSGAALVKSLKGILDDRGRLNILSERYKKVPSDGEATYFYADELMAAGRFAEAEKVLAKTVKARDKKRAEDAALDLGVCRFRMGDFKQAAADLSRFINTHKTSPRVDEARYFWGMSLAASGKKQEGLAALDQLGQRLSHKWLGQESQRSAAFYRNN